MTTDFDRWFDKWFGHVTGPHLPMLRVVAKDLEGAMYDTSEVDGDERFLRIERSAHDGTLYLASFESAEDAASAHDSQEYPEDWPIWRIVDLETGEDVETETRIITSVGGAEPSTFEFLTTDDDGGVVYKPWSNGAGVGFECRHPDGGVEFIYLNPSTASTGSDDGVPTVFLYQGTTGDPNQDGAVTHFVIDAAKDTP